MNRKPTKAQLEQKIQELESEKRLFAETAGKGEERYRTIFEHTGNATILIAEDTTILLANSMFASLTGYTRENIEGKMSWTVFIVPEDLARMKDYHTRRRLPLDSVPGIYEFRLKTRTGDLRHILLTVGLITGTKESVASCMDITESKQALQALARSEEKYRNVLETMEEAYFESDLEGNYTFFNDAFCRIGGYSPQEIASMGYKDLCAPENYKHIRQVYKNVLMTGASRNMEVDEIIRKDGIRRNIEFSPSLIRGPAGEPIGFRGIGRDVTDRIKAQEALQDSERRYRLLAENLTDVIWVLNRDMKHVYVSPSVERLRGFTPEEAMRQSLKEVLAPASYRKAVEVFTREVVVERSGSGHDRGWVQNLELEMLCKDGSTVWTEVKMNILYNDQGEPEGILGVSRDITERKRADQELKKSEELYRTFFEHTATANMIIAEDTTILLVNSNFERVMGYSRNEVEHKMSWTDLIVEDDLTQMKQYHIQRRQLEDAVPDSYEFRAVIRSGEIRNFYMSVAMIPGTTNSIASFIDMTDRWKAEEALRQSEERFRQMARLLPETVFESDDTGKLTFVNEVALNRFGFSPDDMEKGVHVLDVLTPEEYPRAQENFLKVLEGEDLGLREYRARKHDGTTFPALVHSTRILKNGKPVGTRGFVVDISEKKAMEEQLLRAQKMEAIGTLAGGIAHDFNNLLMGILGNISLMLIQTEEGNPFHERLKNMEEYVQRGSELTRRLLGFARGGKYEVRATNLDKFVLKSAEMFGRTKREIRMHHKTVDNLWYVDVDRGQMDQVLLNLFVNAWQAMPGGGDLFLSLENAEISRVGAQAWDVKPGKFVKLTVTDTGIGMDEATRVRIFEPFFSTKERGHGTGLGLASVYGIIKNHGGLIRVESEPGIGTSFMIYLPASTKKKEEEAVKDSRIHKGEETVLLIDDEKMIVDVATAMLEALGYKVFSAAGGRRGIETFELNRDTINLVILDMVMPDIGGRETFEALIKSKPSVKVLLSSGYSLDSQAKEIMDMGCKGFIQKPFSMVDLSEKVRLVLEN